MYCVFIHHWSHFDSFMYFEHKSFHCYYPFGFEKCMRAFGKYCFTSFAVQSSKNKMENFLIKTTVADVSANTHANLINLKWECPLDEALQLLVDNHILSAPVVSEELGGFCAFVDLADFLVFLYEEIRENSIIEGAARLLTDAKRYKVGELADMSNRNHWMPCQTETSLLNALILMSSNGVRRLPIVKADSTLFGVLTESAIVKFLESRMSDLPTAMVQTPISNLPCISSPVLSVNRNSPVMKAFGMLVKDRLSGLAVVGDDGKLCGNISLSDLKNLKFDMDMLTRSHLTVGKYLELGGMRMPIVLTMENTLTDVNNRIHRVYIVKEDGCPEAVISMTDVLGNVVSLLK